MKDFYTRRDIMKSFDISRRVIEGYEEIGLIESNKKDERGGLLYDYSTYCRIAFIRFCQKMGFELKDIINIIDLSNEQLKAKLEQQMLVIKTDIKDLQYLLKLTNLIVDEMEDPRNNKKIFEIFRRKK